jgi:hypothetical protein
MTSIDLCKGLTDHRIRREPKGIKTTLRALLPVGTLLIIFWANPDASPALRACPVAVLTTSAIVVVSAFLPALTASITALQINIHRLSS